MVTCHMESQHLKKGQHVISLIDIHGIHSTLSGNTKAIALGFNT